MTLPFSELTADEAALMIQHGQTLGCSGFTAAGALKSIPLAVAERARAEHQADRPFTVGLLTGASTGPSCDGALAAAEAIHFRAPISQVLSCASKSIAGASVSWTCTYRCCRKMFAMDFSARCIGPSSKLRMSVPAEGLC